MPHNVSLITTIAAALGLALIFGFAASRLRMSLAAVITAIRRFNFHCPRAGATLAPVT